MTLNFTQLKSATLIIFTSVDKQTLCKYHVNCIQIFFWRNKWICWRLRRQRKALTGWHFLFCLHCWWFHIATISQRFPDTSVLFKSFEISQLIYHISKWWYKGDSTSSKITPFLSLVQSGAIFILNFPLKRKVSSLTMKLTIFVLFSVVTLVACSYDSIPAVFRKSVSGKGTNCWCRQKTCTDVSCEEKNCICLVVSVFYFYLFRIELTNWRNIFKLNLDKFSASTQGTSRKLWLEISKELCR